VQEAVEAPRLWTQGFGVEVEDAVPPDVLAALRDRGHDIGAVGNVGGGMSAIRFDADRTMTGAACWRADGTPIGLGGGHARRGVRFRPEAPARQGTA
jgi:gamma-glutamyltranspeptidase/glutathione hydrolase